MSTPLTLDAQARAEIEKRRKQVSDRRIFSRLCALLWLDEGMSQRGFGKSGGLRNVIPVLL